MNVRYRVTLSSEERAQLQALVQGGKGPVRRLKRAQILLAADGGSSDEAIATNVSVGTSTVYRTKRRFVEEGLEPALSEEPRPGAERKLAATEEALLVATACSKPPAGRARWTLALLADEMVRLTSHRSLSVGDDPPPARRKRAEAVAGEDVVHPEGRRRIRRADGGRARAVRRGARRAAPGRLLRRDAAAAHRRIARARRRQAREARARRLRVRAQRHGERLHVSSTRTAPGATRRSPTGARHATSPSACATSSTGTTPRPSASASSSTTSRPTRRPRSTRPSSPDEARRILRRLEFHYTPKHASWLNMVEIEIGVMVAQCLDRRIADKATARVRGRSLGATAEPGKGPHQVALHRARAREKLGRAYPVIAEHLSARVAA